MCRSASPPGRSAVAHWCCFHQLHLSDGRTEALEVVLLIGDPVLKEMLELLPSMFVYSCQNAASVYVFR